jgi:hypothetical protein
MALGAGEAHVSFTLGNFNQSIILDTHPLDILDFEPNDEDRTVVTDRAKRDTLQYFNI